jgi:hypothetical protein
MLYMAYSKLYYELLELKKVVISACLSSLIISLCIN